MLVFSKRREIFRRGVRFESSPTPSSRPTPPPIRELASAHLSLAAGSKTVRSRGHTFCPVRSGYEAMS
jgi:hypothetical protein